MEINLNVNGRVSLILDLAKETFDRIFPSLSAPSQTPQQAPQPTPPEVPTQNAPSGSQPNQPQPQPTPTQANQPTAVAPISPDYSAIIKDAIAEVRSRIEGEDWMTNTTSEGYVKYHRKLNALFKQEANRVAQCKPTQIADEMSCKEFCEFCKMLTVRDGEVIVDRSLDSVINATDSNDDLPF